MVRPDPDRSASRVIGLAGALIMVVMVATSCSSDASTGSAAVSVPTTHPTVDPVTAGSTGTPGAARPGAGSAGSGAAGTTIPATIPGAKSGGTASRRRHPADATGSTDTTTRPSHQLGTTGIPPLQQQFATDDAAFESVLKSVQGSLNHLPSSAGADEVTQAVLPLVAAADQYQSEIVNLPWPGAAKPLAQSLTESLGQLTAVLAGVGRPLVFPSVRAFLSQLSSAAQAIRMAAGAARGHIARS